jgi:hypothetical protein
LVILTLGTAIILFQATPQPVSAQNKAAAALTGQVTSEAEGAMEGVVVSARRDGSTVTVSVLSDAQGRYSFPMDEDHGSPADIRQPTSESTAAASCSIAQTVAARRSPRQAPPVPAGAPLRVGRRIVAKRKGPASAARRWLRWRRRGYLTGLFF